MPSVCNHGFWLSRCKLCQPLPHECDYGNCIEPGTSRVVYYRAATRVEGRLACASHAAIMATQSPVRTEIVDA
jgi:hypothetical protein